MKNNINRFHSTAVAKLRNQIEEEGYITKDKQGQAFGFIARNNDKQALIKTNSHLEFMLRLSCDKLNSIEILIEDFIRQKVGEKYVAPKILNTQHEDIASKNNSFLIAEWKEGLTVDNFLLTENDNLGDLEGENLYEYYAEGNINSYLNTSDESKKAFYKMTALLIAVGMTDLQLGTNIKKDKEDNYILIDGGFFDGFDEKTIKMMENHPNQEIKTWAKDLREFEKYHNEIHSQKEHYAENFTHKVNLSKFDEIPQENLMQSLEKVKDAKPLNSKGFGITIS